jgi:hypothetical protein
LQSKGDGVEYLVVAGMVALVFGAILLFTPSFFQSICLVCDRLLFNLDDTLQPYKNSIGIVLLLVAGWLFYMALRYPAVALMIHPIWIIVLVFALLYIFLPNWLVRISEVTNRNVFPTDKYIMGACRVAGTVLLIMSVYIFHAAYILSRR